MHRFAPASRSRHRDGLPRADTGTDFRLESQESLFELVVQTRRRYSLLALRVSGTRHDYTSKAAALITRHSVSSLSSDIFVPPFVACRSTGLLRLAS
jgi:hypothetical protein